MKYKIDKHTFKLNIIFSSIVLFIVLFLCTFLSVASFIMFYHVNLLISFLITSLLVLAVAFFSYPLLILPISERKQEYMVTDESIVIHYKKDKTILYSDIVRISYVKKNEALSKLIVYTSISKFVFEKLSDKGLEDLYTKINNRRGDSNAFI